MRTLAFILVLLILLGGCRLLKSPTRSFEQYEQPAAPVYSDTAYWAALPSITDPSDTVPVNSLRPVPKEPPVDVFFIYPTLFVKARNWNAPIDDPKFNEDVDESTILHQASVFNESCRVFAPRYRQMTYFGFYDEEGDREKALALAYQDVAAAFDHYLKHWNKNRPLIIAGHSQGSLMALKLLQNRVQDDPLANLLVAAYLVGWPIKSTDLSDIPICESPEQTGCYVTWNTVKWNYKPSKREEEFYTDAQCVNPLSWQVDADYIDYSANLGSLTRKYDTVLPAIADAQISGSLLWIHRKKLPGLAKFMKRFHIADYNLFWMNIRENVQTRIANFKN